MGLTEKHIEYSYTCDGCGKVHEAKSHDPNDAPEGYLVHILRVTAAKKHYSSGALFFDTKECLVNAMQFQISHLTSYKEIQ